MFIKWSLKYSSESPLVNICILGKSYLNWSSRWGAVKVQRAGLNFNTSIESRLLCFLVSSYFFFKFRLVLLALRSLGQRSIHSFIRFGQLILHLSNLFFCVILFRSLSWLLLGFLWSFSRLLGNSNWGSWDLLWNDKSVSDDGEVSVVLIFFLSWLWLFLFGFWGLSLLLWCLYWGRFDLFRLSKLRCLNGELSLFLSFSFHAL